MWINLLYQVFSTTRTECTMDHDKEYPPELTGNGSAWFHLFAFAFHVKAVTSAQSLPADSRPHNASHWEGCRLWTFWNSTAWRNLAAPHGSYGIDTSRLGAGFGWCWSPPARPHPRRCRPFCCSGPCWCRCYRLKKKGGKEKPSISELVPPETARRLQSGFSLNCAVCIECGGFLAAMSKMDIEGSEIGNKSNGLKLGTRP